ncbi:MAG: hypothetical protein ACOCV1_04600 [Bacillota bacterium]
MEKKKVTFYLNEEYYNKVLSLAETDRRSLANYVETTMIDHCDSIINNFKKERI